jgi:hypothetical protein
MPNDIPQDVARDAIALLERIRSNTGSFFLDNSEVDAIIARLPQPDPYEEELKEDADTILSDLFTSRYDGSDVSKVSRSLRARDAKRGLVKRPSREAVVAWLSLGNFDFENMLTGQIADAILALFDGKDAA